MPMKEMWFDPERHDGGGGGGAWSAHDDTIGRVSEHLRKMNTAAKVDATIDRILVGLVFAPFVGQHADTIRRRKAEFSAESMGYVDFFSWGHHDASEADAATVEKRAQVVYEAARSFYPYTSWRYGGGTEVLLVDAVMKSDGIRLEFERTVNLRIDQLEKAGTVQSFDLLVYEIIMHAKDHVVKAGSVAAAFSDRKQRSTFLLAVLRGFGEKLVGKGAFDAAYGGLSFSERDLSIPSAGS